MPHQRPGANATIDELSDGLFCRHACQGDVCTAKQEFEHRIRKAVPMLDELLNHVASGSKAEALTHRIRGFIQTGTPEPVTTEEDG